MPNWARREADLLRKFDGRLYVSATLWNAWPRHAHRASELGYELGYRLTGARIMRSGVLLDFRRDDRPPARARARAAGAVLFTGGAIPTGVPGGPGGVTSREAARARFVLAAAPSGDRRLLVNLLLIWLATMLLVLGGALAAVGQGVGYAFLVTGVLIALSLLAARALRPAIDRRHARHRELLRRYEAERDALV